MNFELAQTVEWFAVIQDAQNKAFHFNGLLWVTLYEGGQYDRASLKLPFIHCKEIYGHIWVILPERAIPSWTGFWRYEQKGDAEETPIIFL